MDPHGSTCILDVFLPVKHSHRGNIVQNLPFRPGQNIPASFLLPAYIICVAVSHADLPVPLIVMPEFRPDQGPQHLRPAQTVKSQFIERTSNRECRDTRPRVSAKTVRITERTPQEGCPYKNIGNCTICRNAQTVLQQRIRQQYLAKPIL